MRRRRATRVAALRVGLGAASSGLVFWLILRFIARQGGIRPLAAVDPSWALGAVLLSTLQTGVVAWRWVFIARELGAGLAYGAALGAYYVSIFLNQLLPFGMLGDALRGLWHARRLGARTAQDKPARPALDAATALILDRASGQLMLLSLVLCVLPLWWRPLSAAAQSSGPIAARVAILTALLVALAALVAYFGRSVLRHTARARAIFFRPKALAAHGACSVLALLLHAGAFYCSARALGFGVSFGLLARVVPLVFVASALPSFALGTGAREASAAALYQLLGLRAADGAASALTLGLLGFVASLPGLVLLVFARLRSGPAH